MRSSTPFEHSGSRDGAVGGGVGIGVVHTTQIQSLHDTPVKQERFMCNLLKHCYIHKAGARRGACFVFTSVHFCQLVWASLPSRTNSFSRDPEMAVSSPNVKSRAGSVSTAQLLPKSGTICDEVRHFPEGKDGAAHPAHTPSRIQVPAYRFERTCVRSGSRISK